MNSEGSDKPVHLHSLTRAFIQGSHASLNLEKHQEFCNAFSQLWKLEKGIKIAKNQEKTKNFDALSTASRNK